VVLRAVIFAAFFFLIAPGFPLMRIVDPTAAPPVAEPLPGELEVKALAAYGPTGSRRPGCGMGSGCCGSIPPGLPGRTGDCCRNPRRPGGRSLPYCLSTVIRLRCPPLAKLDEERATQLRRSVRDDLANPPAKRGVPRPASSGSQPRRYRIGIYRRLRWQASRCRSRTPQRAARRVSEELLSLRASDQQVPRFSGGFPR